MGYWYTKLLVELASDDRPDRPSILHQLVDKMLHSLAYKPGQYSQLHHHFLALAVLGVLELHRFEEHRDDAAKLTEVVLELTKPQTPWNEVIRRRFVEYQQRFSSTANSTGHNLQHLAELAITAPNLSANDPGEAPAPADGNMPQVEHSAMPLDGTGVDVGDAVEGQQQPKEEPATGQIGGVNGHAVDVGAVDEPQGRVLDVVAVLRKGYLVWFEEATLAA